MDTLHRLVGTWRRCVDVFITPSQFVRSKYVEAGWPPERIFVKHNTVLEAPPAKSRVPRGFVCISRLSPEKGVSILLEAWQQAFPDGGEGLQIAGSGDAEVELRKIAAPIRGVEFRGQLPRDDVMKLLAKSRAAVIPSLWSEPFGRVVAESFCAGTPVVASRIGALGEIVDHGKNGLLVPPGSPADLAAALETIGSSNQLTLELGERARTDYELKFDPTVTTDRLISIYEAANQDLPQLRVSLEHLGANVRQ
jgi:glycosyltransferase involved in cell wall biosynthesis